MGDIGGRWLLGPDDLRVFFSTPMLLLFCDLSHKTCTPRCISRFACGEISGEADCALFSTSFLLVRQHSCRDPMVRSFPKSPKQLAVLLVKH